MTLMLPDILLYVIHATTGSLGLYLIKTHKIAFEWGFLLGFGVYLASFTIWLLILKHHPLSVAFPVSSSLLLITTQLVGYFFLGETVSLNKLIGIAFMLLGVFFVYKEILHG